MQLKKLGLNKLSIFIIVCLLATIAWLVAKQNNAAEAKQSSDKSLSNNVNSANQNTPDNSARPALTVTTVNPETRELPLTIAANGNVAAWQEAIIGAEVNGLRINQVFVNVGDSVKKGQILASFASETLQASLAQTAASLKEAEAQLKVAQLNGQRARDLTATGALSQQEIDQLLSTENVAAARVDIAKANMNSQRIQLNYTRLLAPDHGIISSRTASVGQVASAGVELFKLIRQSRLEWRAEVTSADLARLKVGETATITDANGAEVIGRVRTLAPTIDAQTRNALVYVDLPSTSGVKAGMYAKGSFNIGNLSALVIPQQALVLRDGFQFVFVLARDNQSADLKLDTAKPNGLFQVKVIQTKVQIGRRFDNVIEITEGLSANQRLVATGAAFLSDGDTVSVSAGN